jgi:phosphoribosylformylglycinamidine synthase
MHVDLGKVKCDEVLREDAVLFSESASRLLVTVRPDNQAAFEELFAGQDLCLLGSVTGDKELRIVGLGGAILVRAHIDDLKEAWQAPLREM